MTELDCQTEELLPGYVVKIADGNHLGATEHRIKVLVLQSNLSGALPGQSVAVLDPQQMLVVDIFLNEDGHALERSLLPSILETVQAQQVWLADRNFCTRKFLLGIAQKGGDFIIREHKSLPQQSLSALTQRGEIETGKVLEQQVQISHDNTILKLRRVVVQLNKPTRHGDQERRIVRRI